MTLAGQDGQRTRWVTGAVVRVLPDSDPLSSRFRDPAAADPGTVPGTAGGAVPDGAPTGSTPRSAGDDAPGTSGSTPQD